MMNHAKTSLHALDRRIPVTGNQYRVQNVARATLCERMRRENVKELKYDDMRRNVADDVIAHHMCLEQL